MTWNWQFKDWPFFKYNSERFSSYETDFLIKAGSLRGSIKHIDDADSDMLKVDLISNEAYTTSMIEGEVLDRASLQSSIRKHFGLQTDHRRIQAAEMGISEMMVDLYKNFNLPLSHQQLFDWHSMIMNGRRDLSDIGQYRSHEDPMQIVSGPLSRPLIRFEAPPSHTVYQEMNRFIDWFNSDTSIRHKTVNALLKSGIIHLYFESIHPFEDGNGRIGRALSEKVLS